MNWRKWNRFNRAWGFVFDSTSPRQAPIFEEFEEVKAALQALYDSGKFEGDDWGSFVVDALFIVHSKEFRQAWLRDQRFDKCLCSHEKIDHIYGEGPCRPGYECSCEAYRFAAVGSK